MTKRFRVNGPLVAEPRVDVWLNNHADNVNEVRLPFDDSGLRNFLSGRDKIVVSNFKDHMASMHMVLADVRSDLSDVRKQLCTMESKVDVLAIKGDSAISPARCFTGGRADNAARCDLKLPHFNMVFSQDVIVRVVMNSVMHMIT